MSQRPRIAPIPADFFFADPTRSTMSPILVAAMTLAYQYCEIIRSEGFLTEPQLFVALGQISAHGCDIASVIRDLLALNQLDDVGTGYQLPLLHTFLRRRAHAAAEQKRYHESAGRRGKSRGGNRDRHTAGEAREPVLKYRNRASTMPPNGPSVDPAPASARDGANSAHRVDAESCSDPVPTSASCSASAFSQDTERSTQPAPTSAEGRSGSGLSDESLEGQKQNQTHATGATGPKTTESNDTAPRTDWSDMAWVDAESRELVEELLAKIGKPVSRLEPEHRGRTCTRGDYGPPPWMLAVWVTRSPMDQILDDLARYREKGHSDITAVREHDSRFEAFMKATLGLKHKQLGQRLIAQRAVREAEKRYRKQRAEREAAMRAEQAEFAVKWEKQVQDAKAEVNAVRKETEPMMTEMQRFEQHLRERVAEDRAAGKPSLWLKPEHQVRFGALIV